MGFSKQIFMEEREYDEINSEHQGFEMEPQESMITEQQRRTLYDLIQTAVVTPDEKQAIESCIECKMTFLEAEGLKQELRAIQQDSINLARDGKLKNVDFNKALRKLIDMPNT